jgi:hypothetical protein
MRWFRWTSAAVLLAVVGTGCQDLDVVNTNQPDRERAQSDPVSLHTMIASSYSSIYGRLRQGSFLYNSMPLIADEASGTYANNAALLLSSEPRVAFSNNPTSDSHAAIARSPWESMYEPIANAVDLEAAVASGIEIVLETQDGFDATGQTLLWSKFLRALGHGYLGLYYDRAFIQTLDDLNTDVAEREMVPYTDVIDHAISVLDEVIADANANPDMVIPDAWYPNKLDHSDITMTELKQLANHYAATFMVYEPRTPEDRENLRHGWDEVIRRLDAGLQETFWIDTTDGWDNNVWFRMFNEGSFTAYADGKLYGPADVSGSYQNWLSLPWSERDRFVIETPDLRFPAGSPDSPPEDGDRGWFFQFETHEWASPERGLYHRGYYQFEGPTTTSFASGEGDYTNIPFYLHPMDEANLFRAEALYFQGDLQGAADLVNISRTRVGDPSVQTNLGGGGLPPVTVDGAPGGPGVCVPHKSLPTQQCADLYEALMYERMLQLFGLDSMRAWLDSRGFGRLAEGTFLQIPVPARELGSLGIEEYTFGGVGGPSAAAPYIR